jgi:hypothetical protein
MVAVAERESSGMGVVTISALTVAELVIIVGNLPLVNRALSLRVTKIGGLATWLVKTDAGVLAALVIWGIGVTEFTRADAVSSGFGIETIGLLARRAGLKTDGSVKAGATGAGAWRFLLGKLTDRAILCCWGVIVLILPDGVRIGKALTCGTALTISGAVVVGNSVTERGVVAAVSDGCGVLTAPTTGDITSARTLEIGAITVLRHNAVR